MSAKNESLVANPPELYESLGLQTYEFFLGGPDTQKGVSEFIAGTTTRLHLDTPALTSGGFTEIIASHLANLSHERGSDTVLSSTASYRYRETSFLTLASRLVDDPDAVSQSEKNAFQELNDQLYGVPELDYSNALLHDIWSKLDKCQPSLSNLVHDLEEGFTFNGLDGEVIEIPGLPRPAEVDQLIPEIDPGIKEWVKTYLNEMLQPSREYIYKYCETILARGGKVTPQHLAELFPEAIKAQGIEGIDIVTKDHGRGLSWSSNESAVVIGLERPGITDADEVFSIFVHEVFWHGQRSLNGRALENDALASGLYTEADNGESPDYLTFEEGMASVLQELIFKSEEQEGLNRATGNYINNVLAMMGWGPRQIYEVMKRVRIVTSAGNDNQVDLNRVERRAETETANQVVRLFRGTPAERELKTTSGATLHFSKDLAYKAGEFKAKAFLNYLGTLSTEDRINRFDKLFFGKYDPTNHRQQAYVDNVLSGRI